MNWKLVGVRGKHMRSLNSLLVAGAVLVLSHSAGKASLIIDFTDADGGNPAAVAPFEAGDLTEVYNGLTVSLSSTGGAINFNTGGPIGGACASSPLACDRDGIGVGDTEIDKGIFRSESVTVDFSEAVNVETFFFLDLYPGFNPDIARVQLRLNNVNVSPNLSFGPTGEAFGFREASIAPVLADRIIFTTNTFDDYALAGIEIEAIEVSSPATLPILLAAIGGVFVAGRRRLSR